MKRKKQGEKMLTTIIAIVFIVLLLAWGAPVKQKSV